MFSCHRAISSLFQALNIKTDLSREKNLRLALKYGTLHRDTLLLLLLILSRHCLLADEIFFTPSSAKRKKKSKYFKKHNSRTQSKHMKQAWSAGKRGWPSWDLFQLFIWLVEKMALLFFQTNHRSRSSNNNTIPKHFSLPIGKFLHL